MIITFWNTNKKDISSLLPSIIGEYTPDILVLCEPNSKCIANIEAKISTNFGFSSKTIKNSKMVVFLKNSISISYIHSLYRIIHLNIIHNSNSLNLFFVHLIDKMNNKDSDQLSASFEINRSIREIEIFTSSENSIVIGDFNMNPFDTGMIASNGFHAVSDLDIAAKGERIVQNTPYKFFYNPMWSFLGDKSLGKTPGTYYLQKSTYDVQFWNILDQIIFRHSISLLYPNFEIVIHDNLKTLSFTNKDGFIENKYSDHLPITLKLR